MRKEWDSKETDWEKSKFGGWKRELVGETSWDGGDGSRKTKSYERDDGVLWRKKYQNQVGRNGSLYKIINLIIAWGRDRVKA